MGTILTAVVLLTKTETSMQIVGKTPVKYTQQGHAHVFPSAAYHFTKSAQNDTMKMWVFLRSRREIKTETTRMNQRITRSQMRYRQPRNRTKVSWDLEQYLNYRIRDERAWKRAKGTALGTQRRPLNNKDEPGWSDDSLESSDSESQE